MKILVVDDDRELRGILAFAFRQAGYLVFEAADSEQPLELFRTEAPDLIGLDVNMPRMAGLDVCRRVRSVSGVPILMHTVRGQDDDVVKGLDCGADDYMAKPFRPRTLLARVRALFRRAGMAAPAQEHCVGGLTLDVANQLLTLPGRPPVRLTRLELRLVQLLFAHAGHVVRSGRLFGHVWGSRGGGDRELLKQLVHRVRQKIEDEPSDPQYQLNEPGIGYRMAVHKKRVENGDP
jgi:DNA-binding response OmpR family regulator